MTRSASIWRASSSACSGLRFAAGFRRSWGPLWAAPPGVTSQGPGEPEDFKLARGAPPTGQNNDSSRWRGLVHKGQDIDRQGRNAVLGCHRALAGAGLPVPGSGHWWNAK